MNDYELTTLVEAAASGAVNSRARIHGGPNWDAMDGGDRNAVREHALPFIYHGTKALAGLGYSRPRTVSTVEELDALPDNSVIEDGAGDIGVLLAGNVWYPETAPIPVRKVAKLYLPASVLYEPEGK